MHNKVQHCSMPPPSLPVYVAAAPVVGCIQVFPTVRPTYMINKDLDLQHQAQLVYSVTRVEVVGVVLPMVGISGIMHISIHGSSHGLLMIDACVMTSMGYAAAVVIGCLCWGMMGMMMIMSPGCGAHHHGHKTLTHLTRYGDNAYLACQ